MIKLNNCKNIIDRKNKIEELKNIKIKIKYLLNYEKYIIVK